MNEPQPNEERSCPECGATLSATSDSCWLCHSTVPIVATVVAERAVPWEHRAAYQFSLATMMLTITLVAVLLGVFLMSPGIGILLAVVVAPAFLRTCIVMARRKARGQPVSLADKLGSFAASFAFSLGFVVFVGLAGAVAVVAAFFVICWAALGTSAAP